MGTLMCLRPQPLEGAAVGRSGSYQPRILRSPPARIQTKLKKHKLFNLLIFNAFIYIWLANITYFPEESESSE